MDLQADLADLDTWLGLAQRQIGDLAGARYSFEEALDVISIRHNGPEGFSYTTPMAQQALAELLATTDPARAKAIAARAKAGFERLRR